MPHVPSIPPSTPFFARVDRFTCECPACSFIIVAQLDHAGHKTRADESAKIRRHPRRAREVTYNALTQRLACPRCKKTYQIGLVAYPVLPRSKKALEPSDTVPDPRQLLAIREQAGKGFWAIDPKASGEAVNLAITQPCSCPHPYGYDTACAIHGLAAEAAEAAEGGESGG